MHRCFFERNTDGWLGWPRLVSIITHGWHCEPRTKKQNASIHSNPVLGRRNACNDCGYQLFASQFSSAGTIQWLSSTRASQSSSDGNSLPRPLVGSTEPWAHTHMLLGTTNSWIYWRKKWRYTIPLSDRWSCDICIFEITHPIVPYADPSIRFDFISCWITPSYLWHVLVCRGCLHPGEKPRTNPTGKILDGKIFRLLYGSFLWERYTLQGIGGDD